MAYRSAREKRIRFYIIVSCSLVAAVLVGLLIRSPREGTVPASNVEFKIEER